MAELVDAWGLEPHGISVTVQVRLPVPYILRGVFALVVCLVVDYVKTRNCCFRAY
jgi:hypothetical protein